MLDRAVGRMRIFRKKRDFEAFGGARRVFWRGVVAGRDGEADGPAIRARDRPRKPAFVSK